MPRSSTRTFGGRKPFRFRSEWKIFVWCFLTAIVLWLLISLNEMYNSRILVNVHYTNYPDREVFVKPLPRNFSIAVNAKGWDLFGNILNGNGEDITIDLKEFENQSYILTRWLKVNLQQQLPQKVVINDIYPDTIPLNREAKMSKKVPVKLNLSLSYQKEFAQGDAIKYAPDSVLVEGPVSLINDIKYVNTENLVLEGLNKTVNTSIKLQKPAQHNIKYSRNKLDLTVPVYQLTEQVKDIPVEIINPKIAGNIRLIPQKVTITYQTTLNRFDRSDTELFEAVVDGSTIDSTRSLPLKVQIISKPDYTYQLRISPEYVDYLIQK